MSQVKKSNVRKLLLRIGLVGGLMIGVPLLLVLAALVAGRGALVIVDNSNDFPVQLRVDGKDLGTLAAHEHRRVDSDIGEHTIVARGPNGFVDEGRFTLPKRKDPFFSVQGLYNIGGAGRYVTVALCYGAQHCDQGIDPLGGADHFILLPYQVHTTDLDAPIPASAPQGDHTFLCHAGARPKQVGCPLPDTSWRGILGLR
jgi:hypothetical protein